MADGTNSTDADATDESTDVTEETQETEEKPDGAELERLRAALAKANKEAEKNRLRLKEVDDSKLSEIEKAKRDALDAAQELAKERRANLRNSVALTEGVPAKWVGRLQGDTEEELVADARSILADLNKTKRPEPDQSQGPRQTAKVSGWDAGKAEAQKRFGGK
jgi:hypothetical protein